MRWWPCSKVAVVTIQPGARDRRIDSDESATLRASPRSVAAVCMSLIDRVETALADLALRRLGGHGAGTVPACPSVQLDPPRRFIVGSHSRSVRRAVRTGYPSDPRSAGSMRRDQCISANCSATGGPPARLRRAEDERHLRRSAANDQAPHRSDASRSRMADDSRRRLHVAGRSEQFGRDLKGHLRLAAVEAHFALDVGENEVVSRFGPTVIDAAREKGAQLLHGVHGLLVYEETGRDLVGWGTAGGIVSSRAGEAVRRRAWTGRAPPSSEGRVGTRARVRPCRARRI